jgi:hypothetical protein
VNTEDVFPSSGIHHYIIFYHDLELTTAKVGYLIYSPFLGGIVRGRVIIKLRTGISKELKYLQSLLFILLVYELIIN